MKLEYASSGCNRSCTFLCLPSCQSNEQEGQFEIAYAASKAICLFSPSNPSSKTIFDSEGHKGEITALVRGNGSIISAARDGSICIWRKILQNAEHDYTMGKIHEHEYAQREIHENEYALMGNIQAFKGAAVDSLASSCGWIAACSSEEPGCVKLWKESLLSLPQTSSKDDISACFCTLKSKPNRLITTLSMHSIDGKTCFLAIAYTDCSVEIWVSRSDESSFDFCTTLSGHEGWISSCDWTTEIVHASQSSSSLSRKLLLLATGSQDRYIRIWSFEREYVDENESSYDSTSSFSTLKHFMVSQDDRWSVNLEAVLMGHDDWVLSVRWEQFNSLSGDFCCQFQGQQKLHSQSMEESELLTNCCNDEDNRMEYENCTFDPEKMMQKQQISNALLADQRKIPRLVSTSADKSLIVWECSQESTDHKDSSALWSPQMHLGTLTGGNSLGLCGALMVNGQFLYANDWGGSILHWEKTFNGKWQQRPEKAPGAGHFRPVTGISWAENPFANDSVLISCSLDQTSRIHSKIKIQSQYESLQERWIELARPQIHGYDLKCICFIKELSRASKWSFVSGADEKCLRVFEGTKDFVQRFAAAQGLECPEEMRKAVNVAGAQVPALGLSNKAVDLSSMTLNEEEDVDDQSQSGAEWLSSGIDHHHHQTKNDHSLVPSEHELANASLWPEVDKLYGHLFEIVSLSCSATLIASSSKSFKTEYSNVILWNASTLQQHQILPCVHSLTTTATAFSPRGGTRLLTVSRDRSIAIFEAIDTNNSEELGQFVLKSHLEKAHSRIIWDCCWVGEDRFVTVSRDGSVKLWLFSQHNHHQMISMINSYSHPQGTGINCVDCCCIEGEDDDNQRHFKLALGMEDGSIIIGRIDGTLGQILIDDSMGFQAHSDQVNQVKWDSKGKRLASCSDDHFVKIFIN